MNFRELGLIDPILKALEAQGYKTPTPIQQGAIPPALAGQDVLGCAQTGTGKTCAFSTPILQRLNGRNANPRTIKALVLTPTRELALQIHDSLISYGKHLSLRSAVIFGGVGQQPQMDRIKKGIDILVATPGRLLDLHGQNLLDLSHIEMFVLDEADRMLDMGFIHDVRRVLHILPEKKQTLFFSATMPPEVMELVNSLLHNYARVEVNPVSSPVEVIRQSLYYVDRSNKIKLLSYLIDTLHMDSVIVFARTKHGVNRIANALIKVGISAAAIHGNKSQGARQQALTNFKNGRIKALVATDIAARGIDIDELKWVINYDLPEVAETYVHRIGRTGRAGHDGSAISFCRADEKHYLRQIERLLGKKLPVVEEHPFPMVEPPTGVDPMVQARREAKENARSKRMGKPQQNLNNSSKSINSYAPAPLATNEPTQKAFRRGVRKGDLSSTMPTTPSMPTGEFVRPDPMKSDVVLDATARLLAPRKPIYANSQTTQTGTKQGKGQGNRNKKKFSQEDTPTWVKSQSQFSKSSTSKREFPNQKTGHSIPHSTKGKCKRDFSSRNRPPSEYRPSRQKDSTERSDSVMKPYYLSDE